MRTLTVANAPNHEQVTLVMGATSPGNTLVQPPACRACETCMSGMRPGLLLPIDASRVDMMMRNPCLLYKLGTSTRPLPKGGRAGTCRLRQAQDRLVPISDICAARLASAADRQPRLPWRTAEARFSAQAKRHTASCCLKLHKHWKGVYR